MASRLYKCTNFIFIYKEEKYESQQHFLYHGDVTFDVKRSFSQGVDITNQSKKRKNDRQRRKSEGGIVTTIRRKLSVVETRPVVKLNFETTNETITQVDVDRLNLDVKKNGDTVVVTIVNEIDPNWFRKSVKLFFQRQLLNNGLL